MDQVRQNVFLKSQEFSETQLTHWGAQIINRALRFMQDQHLFEIPELRVGLYHSMKTEVDLSPLFPFFRSLGWTLYFPKVLDKKTRDMKFFEVSFEASGEVSGGVPDRAMALWEKGSYGLLEPQVSSSSEVGPGPQLDLIFLPGVAFGEMGQCIGRGEGYYDRLVSSLPGGLKIALTFDFQLIFNFLNFSSNNPGINPLCFFFFFS